MLIFAFVPFLFLSLWGGEERKEKEENNEESKKKLNEIEQRLEDKREIYLVQNFTGEMYLLKVWDVTKQTFLKLALNIKLMKLLLTRQLEVHLCRKEMNTDTTF